MNKYFHSIDGWNDKRQEVATRQGDFLMLIKKLSMCISGIERNVIILLAPVQIWINRLNSYVEKETGCREKGR